ncbi:hypothetical protein SPRG_05183 [Saprolegnia parasitica CBS 223.65]|uniref:Cyclic nucleotide-binding domain-containing protein n=1 Tax=Saprolegnia parasitica (strain CBS 223.65) TaxID=695850 RepID=A0A067CGV9_SAPPC|nr:hypothetical protein SPRG_05183 [Saprolegnia parasitica CBS 223.65]KDO29994.1 hypothetical protein SPRG_05183 [Saprolegnia parasitica CBS 223.65]|eukprot:XP_012199177.1 hypothetical protein SPRG_05183 [Saprolegnia parasitica CBS 223.65]
MLLGKKPLPPHRQRTLRHLFADPEGLEYLVSEDATLYPPVVIHGRVFTNIDPQTRERAQKRWDALRDVVIRTPELTRIAQKLQESVRILKMHPSERSDTDVAQLYAWLMSQENLSPVFKPTIGKNVCREMEFLHLRPNDIIVHQGDIGETCFIVVSGQVGIHVRTPDEQAAFAKAGGRQDFPPDPPTCQQEQEAARQAVSSRRSSGQVGGRRLSNFLPPAPPKPVVTPESLARCGNKVATLRSGATFGEICLIEADSKRTATVIVDATCPMANLIVLSASSYAKMTRSPRTEGTISDHIAFLAQMHLFKTWSKMQLMRLASSLRYMVFAPQQYILRKNVDVEYFYMFLGGEAKEVSSVSFHEDVLTGYGRCCFFFTTIPIALPSRRPNTRVTTELTHLSKFDVAGLVLGKKMHLCPVDVKAGRP